MKTNFKPLIVLIGAITLVACNSGGSENGGYTPSPTPTPTNESALSPLILQSIGEPLVLDKAGGNSVWYMLVTNPNSTAIYLNWQPNTDEIFKESDYSNQYIIHPVQNVESYFGEVKNYSNTPDCLSLLDYGKNNANVFGILNLNANQSCVYKFRAFWNFNFNMPETTIFSLDYGFLPKGKKGIEYTYCTKGVSDKCAHVIPYDSRNTLSYKSYTLKSKDNIESQLNIQGLQQSFYDNTIFTYSGNKIFSWTSYNPEATKYNQITSTIFSYNLHYDVLSNTLIKSNYESVAIPRSLLYDDFYYYNFNNSGWVSQLGDNFGAAFFQNTTPSGDFNTVTGTMGSKMLDSANNTLLSSTNGNFESGYTYMGDMPYGYNLVGWDESNNIIVLDDGSPYGNGTYCYNLQTKEMKHYGYYNNGKTLYMPKSSNRIAEVINYEKYLLVAGDDALILGQNGKSLYVFQSTPNLYRLDVKNCTLVNNSVMPFAFYNKNKTYGIVKGYLYNGQKRPDLFVLSINNMK